jgi:hypothetical protein
LYIIKYIVAKKKSTLSFKDSLESLFDSFDQAVDMPILVAKPKTRTERKTTGSASGKSFLGDLDTFFKDAIEETLAEKMQEVRDGKKPERLVRRTKPNFGIDNLLQSTVENLPTKTDFKEQKIMLTFDIDKLNKLNEIADIEKARLKDIIDQLVVSYIQTWEQKKHTDR